MTLADDLKSLAHGIRAIPGQLGIRPHSVALVESTWSGANSGDGAREDYSTPILESGQNPKVRWLSDEELAVGGLSSGVVDIGPITSDHATVRRLAALRGDELQDSDARYLRIVGPKHPNGAKYQILELRVDRAIHYKIRVAPVEVAGA
jgi:hypothetical protein